MYKIIGADGKEYGPVTFEQVRQWIAQGRVYAQTRIQPAGATEWKTAIELPELRVLFGPAAPVPGSYAAGMPLPPESGQQQTGLAITSFVLGLLSLFCLLFTGIPAIICGHLAHSRARRLPGQYSGAGFAIAGFVLGYVGLLLTALVPALVWPALTAARKSAMEAAQSISCVSNLKQIGLAFRTWEIDHSNQLPFNVSTNAGGTLEVCAPASDGFDRNAALHFMTLSNELGSPMVLVCLADSSRHAALDFEVLRAENVTYQLHSGTNIDGTNPRQVIAVCPIHGHKLLYDGSVSQQRPPGWAGRSKRRGS